MQLLLIFILTLYSVYAFCHSLSPVVISTSGNHDETSTISLSWIFGEPIVETASNSSNIFIDNVQCSSNFFDGIALFASENIFVTNFICCFNNAAGLGLDNKLKDVLFANGIIKGNKDVGIFARDVDHLNFNDLVVKNNRSHGCFFSHGSPSSSTGCKYFFFLGCSFLGNKGLGLFFDSNATISSDNCVVGCRFKGNTCSGIHNTTHLQTISSIFLKF